MTLLESAASSLRLAETARRASELAKAAERANSMALVCRTIIEKQLQLDELPRAFTWQSR
jgi:hypothetical protein